MRRDAPQQSPSAPGGLAGRPGWTRDSSILLGTFLSVIFLIVWVWWPLAEEYLATFNPAIPWWRQFDWLLVGIFAVMSALITWRADLRTDLPLALVGLAGGLVIESWGTQTQLWTYYTLERPPLWILPAWPVATLAIERLAWLWPGVSGRQTTDDGQGRFSLRSTFRRPSSTVSYSPLARTSAFFSISISFFALMLYFSRHTLHQPLTLLALALVLLLWLSPGDRGQALRRFAAGAALGYFLELWGTTRECWTYYTGETPPLFAVLAHGMAAFAFWRTRNLLSRR